MVKFSGLGEELGNSAEINWLKIENDKPRDLVILSNISRKVVGDDNFVVGRDLIVYRAWKPFRNGFNFTNSEGKTVYVTLPVLSEDDHDPEENVNPYVDILGLLGIETEIKNNHLLWVMDAETKEIFLYNPPATVVYELAAKEETIVAKRKKLLRGSVVTISRTGTGKNTKYSVTPMMDFVNVDDVELPCDLRDIPSIKLLDSVDKQIKFLNDIKNSVCAYIGMPVEQWVFTDDNRVKE